MPIYTYRCETCGGVFDAPSTVERRHDARTCVDDNCMGPAPKVPTSSSFVLKGKGFHKNDYSKHGPR